MISDSITNASAATSAPSAQRFRKEEEGFLVIAFWRWQSNKSAKLKQKNKLGLRREQWLSQVIREDKSQWRSIGRKRDGQQCHHHESFMESPSNSSSTGGTDLSTNFSGSSSTTSQ
ncbi:RING/U-box superfamily protein [Raphanus sativus]|nr:RING/U-box superfamily protein [Raphanus sativus]